MKAADMAPFFVAIGVFSGAFTHSGLEEVIELAGKGMLPKGPVGREMYTKLHVYAGPEHDQAAQKPEALTF